MPDPLTTTPPVLEASDRDITLLRTVCADRTAYPYAVISRVLARLARVERELADSKANVALLLVPLKSWRDHFEYLMRYDHEEPNDPLIKARNAVHGDRMAVTRTAIEMVESK